MAYNPAAPAAPEPIAHREKTPPPPDAHGGTGLSAAAQHDHSSSYSGPPQQQHPSYPSYQQQFNPSAAHNQSTPLSSPGPLQRASTTSSFPPPPPPQQAGSTGPPQSQNAFAPPPTDSFNQLSPPPQPGQMLRQHTMPAGYPSYAQQQQQPYADYGQQPGGHTPLQSPGLPSPNPAAGAMPGQHGTQQIPHVQYGQYSSYLQQQPQPPQQQDAYNVHGQPYRPSQAEASYGHHTEDNHGAGPGAAPPGRLEQGLGKVEKGVGRFLKRLDKKL